MRHGAWLVAPLLVAPLWVPVAWAGVHVALRADPVLGVLSPLEQPLSIRSIPGVWTLLLVVGWFALGVRSRNVRFWEWTLVVAGSVLGLVRLGNVWLSALLLLLPLARQLGLQRLAWVALGGLGVAGVAVGIATAIAFHPPAVPRVAATDGSVFADWRWAPELQSELGPSASVLGANGLLDSPASYWLDYIRVVRGHERWDSLLDQHAVNLLVLDPTSAADVVPLVRGSPRWRVLVDTADTLVAVRA